MSFWNLVYYGWFAFMAMAVFAVIGAAVYESSAMKRRRARAAEGKKKGKGQEGSEAGAAEEPSENGAVEEQEAGVDEQPEDEQLSAEEADPLAGPVDWEQLDQGTEPRA